MKDVMAQWMEMSTWSFSLDLHSMLGASAIQMGRHLIKNRWTFFFLVWLNEEAFSFKKGKRFTVKGWSFFLDRRVKKLVFYEIKLVCHQIRLTCNGIRWSFVELCILVNDVQFSQTCEKEQERRALGEPESSVLSSWLFTVRSEQVSGFTIPTLCY